MSLSISKLDDSNYAEWSILMRAMLVRQGLWDITSGNTPCPHGSPNSTALESVHQARGLGTRLARRRNLYQMRKCNDQTMTTWIADVRRAVFHLKAIGASITDEDHILVVTSGLLPSFEHFVVTLDATLESELTLELVHRRLLNEDSCQHPFPSLQCPDLQPAAANAAVEEHAF
ncbi:hypothetical protein K466DRAFT_577211 [Polyporus arcularius HHB13444]|uniref:DUF4219 domain-containing protein n=1 Tax=Polyporus arcularius HHB13444 TaxID=1314778 RepID=A0A5C3P4S8_9APHY|nr:hypothetical protein K466DRAFT_577211 [Polyporus arcularius HHB13444]